MAPIKWEENIKEKLEKRTLEPSANAWLDLEKKLDANTEKQRKLSFWWLGVAASFIAILFVIQHFVSLNKGNSVVPTEAVISNVEVVKEPDTASETRNESEQVVPSKMENISNNKHVESLSKDKNVVVNNSEKREKHQNIHSSITNTIAINSKTKKEFKEVNGILEMESNTTTAVLSNAMLVETEEKPILALESTASEVDQLLDVANKKIQFTNKQIVKTISVDANALLEDVETEMPPSLRGQIFKVIERNFKTASAAVSNRNE